MVFAQPESRVTIIIPLERASGNAIKVESFRTSGELFDVVYINASQDDDDSARFFSGLVRLPIHAQQRMQSRIDSDLGVRALVEALIYGIPYVTASIVPLVTDFEPEFLQNKDTATDGRPHSDRLSRYFPAETLLYASMSQYLGPYLEPRLKKFKELPLGATGMSLCMSIDARMWAKPDERLLMLL